MYIKRLTKVIGGVGIGLLCGLSNLLYAAPLLNDLEVDLFPIDTYLNAGSVLRYQIYYRNNGSEAQDNVVLQTALPSSLKFLDSSQALSNTPERLYGGNNDVCYTDFIDETGIYMDLFDGFAQSQSFDNFHDFLLNNPDLQDLFNGSPFNGSPSQIGEFIDFILTLEGDSIQELMMEVGIDITQYDECGYDGYSNLFWNLGSLAPYAQGYITLYTQVLQNTQSDVVPLGTMNQSQNTILAMNNANTQEGEVRISITNNSASGFTKIFANKSGGPLLRDVQSMLESVLTDDMTEKQKAIALRQLVKDYTYNYPTPQSMQWYQGNLWWMNNSDYTNPVSMLTTLYGMCGEINGTLGSLAVAAGLDARFMQLNGHIGLEILIDGQWAWMDADGGVYWEDTNDGHIYSSEELGNNPSIILNDPKDNHYELNYYVDLISTTGDNFFTTPDFTHPYRSSEFELYPNDTITYTYTDLQQDSVKDYGEGLITRNLQEEYAITMIDETSFIFTESLPYLPIDMWIETTEPLTDDVSVYLSTPIDQLAYYTDVELGRLVKRLGYPINTQLRNTNYYSYSLRFECESACDIESIIPKIAVKTSFTFNSLAIPYTDNVDVYLTGSENFDLTAVGEYSIDNKIILDMNISPDIPFSQMPLNNNKKVELNTLTHEYAILPSDGNRLPTVLLAKGYTYNDSDSMFIGSGFLGDVALDLFNTNTLAESIILSSQDRKIQAYLPENLVITPSGDSCHTNIVNSPVDRTDQFTGLQKVFELGSPCDGTTLNLSEPVAMRVYIDEPIGDIIDVSVSHNGVDRTPLSGTKIDDHIVEIYTNHFSLFSINTSNSAQPPILVTSGGGSSSTLQKDNCPEGDYSDSYYDDTCEGTISDELLSGGIIDSCDKQEFKDAYDFAFENNITTLPTCKEANLDGLVLRKHAAKFMVNYAMNVLGKKPDKTKICDFDDMGGESKEMKKYAILVCQLNIMGMRADGITPNTFFDPNTYINKAMFTTMISRLMYGSLYNNGNELLWWEGHVNVFVNKKIINITEKLFNPIQRSTAMIMLMRASHHQ